MGHKFGPPIYLYTSSQKSQIGVLKFKYSAVSFTTIQEDPNADCEVGESCRSPKSLQSLLGRNSQPTMYVHGEQILSLIIIDGE